MSVINTNTLSLVTQNNLTKSQASLNSAVERLSSGMRINSAKDDAAGQAIANRFSANIKGLTQAQRNANDGISLAQTTEGALNEINTNLQRVRELTVQSANGSNSNDDKASIQAEITQRLAEIDRTSTQTDFNGVKVLSSAAATLKVQVGSNDGETIDIGLKEISAKTLGLTGFNVDGTGPANKAANASDLLVAGWAKGATTNDSTVYTKSTVAATANDVLGKMQDKGTVLIGTAATYTYSASSKSYTLAETGRTSTALTDSLKAPAGQSQSATVTLGTKSTDIKIDSAGGITAANGTALFVDATGNLTATDNGGTAAAATVSSLTAKMVLATDTIKNNTTGALFTATTTAGTMNVTNEPVAADTVKALVNTFAAVAAIDIDGAGTTAAYSVATNGAVTNGGAQFVDISGALGTAATETITMNGNGIVTDSKANTVYADAAKVGGLTTKPVSNSTATVDPLKALDAALSTVDKLRGSLGAVQNRFDSVISNLGTTVTNLSASRSRIEDADYATEVSNMTRAQILQQAGTSVLAKANQSTQGVMSLLQ